MQQRVMLRYTAELQVRLFIPMRRCGDPATLIRNRQPQSDCRHSIPEICRSCCFGSRTLHVDIVRQLVHAHAYWRMKGLAVDLVIWNEDLSGYRQPLHDEIIGMIAQASERNP